MSIIVEPVIEKEIIEIPADENQKKALSSDSLIEIEAYKKQIEESYAAEKEALIAQMNDQTKILSLQIEELKVAQMKEDERKRYDEEKKIQEEAKEKLALADRNASLQREIETIRTKQYIAETMSKYSFIEPKYKDRLTKMNKEEFDRVFNDDFINDQRELHEFRSRDKTQGNRNAFGGFANQNQAPSADPATVSIQKYKEEQLKKILNKR
ncbi:MAG: hypothetical protein ACRCZ9_05725 [Fusobacteriaceae bacterium]